MNDEILIKIIELAKQYNVTKLIQFGSSIESLEECNDIDLACDGLYDKNFFSFGAKLEKLFNKPVDLLPLQPSDKFIEYISKHCRVLYEDNLS